MTELRLVIFDVDGTLVDSQAHIVHSMTTAFLAHGLTPPNRAEILSIVGLSLPVAMARLLPGRPQLIGGLVDAYKDAFAQSPKMPGPIARSPLYPGVSELLARLGAEAETLLAIATSKSRRGLDHLVDLHGWHGLFQSVQCADDHPSKPHPSMIEACLRETGVDVARAVVIGDTTYDMQMGRAAGITALGVAWGYHSIDALHQAGADHVIDHIDTVDDVIAGILGAA